MKKWLTAGAVLGCIVIGGLAFYSRYHTDRMAPEISFSDNLHYVDGLTEEQLLSGVRAVDEEDGDVSDSLTIESMIVNENEQTAVIKYAARDSHNNVAKKSRTIPFEGTDLKKQEVSFTDENRFGGIQETESEYQTEKQGETELLTESEIQTETETESETETETEITAPGAPHIKLTENHAEITVGETFDPLLYVAMVEDDYDNIYSLWRDIQLSGDYDVNTPGVYNLTFYVTDSSGNVSNHAKFRLTVKSRK